MGSMVAAQCECGFEEQFSIGAGWANCNDTCSFPALCKRCGEMIEVNLLSPKAKCSKCRSRDILAYDDDSLRGDLGSVEVMSWNVEEQLGRIPCLTDGTYYCPKCKQLSLRFFVTGFFD